MTSVSLHPLLRYSHRDPIGNSCSAILWDLREPPSTCVRLVTSPNRRVAVSDLCQPATSPPVTALCVSCDLFPSWRIEARNYHGVTILDLLEAIYHTLQARVRTFEWEAMSDKHRERVGMIFDQRWRTSPEPLRVRANGLTRADCLLQSTCFAGLSMSYEMGFVCILSLSRNSRLR
jgi:hypothetical protein